MVVGVIILMLLMAVGQVIPLMQNQQYRELLGFGLVWLVASVLSVLVAADIYLPGLLDVIEGIYGFLGLK